MIVTQIKPTSHRLGAGFSMIDVLVAIIVLATGLLALAALQGALTRNSADARARSQIAAYSEGLIDQLRSGGYNNIASVPAFTATSGGTAALRSEASAAQTAAGVSGLTTTITSDIYNGSGSTFTKAGTGIAASANSYKQVGVTTAWTDASGQSRTLALNTIVDTTQTNQIDQTLITKSLGSAGSVPGPIVRQYNPGATPGVIPIAIGSSATAATNPQPEVLGKSGSSISGVTYNVLTYTLPDTSQESVIQQNVDTRVITCSCKYGTGVTNTANVFAQPFRPTYWSGSNYVSPSATKLGYSTTGVDSSATQDSYCDVCCRDRNDPAATGDDQTLFDPFTTDHAHYRYNSSSTLVAVPSTDTTDAYLNACRLIRVNGQYAVAVDLQNYFFGLLATTNTGTSPIPDPTAETTYESFVTTFMTNSISTLAAGNGPASIATATSAYATAGLDSPTNIGLTGTTDKRYLQARGLYIDYLEPAALTAINNAISTCPSTSTTASCVLPLLPFTTINETELANWTSSVGGVITVTDTASLTSDDPTAPLRGVTTEVNGATNGATANAVATIGISNSGVVGNIASWAVDPNDQTTLTDSQKFTIGGSSGGGSGTLYFNVAVSFPTSPSAYNWVQNLASGNVPTIKWNGTATQLGTAVSNQSTTAYTASTSSPYSWYWYSSCTTTTTGSGKNQVTTTTCAPSQVTPTSPITAPVGLNFIVQGYNLYTDTLGADSKAVATDGTGNTCPVATGALECFNFPVNTAGIKVNGTLVSGATSAAYPTGTTDLTGQVAETMVTIPSTPGISSTSSAAPDVVTIAFGSPTITVATGTCVATKVKGKTTYVYQIATSCPQ